jgi:hypothetical protein
VEEIPGPDHDDRVGAPLLTMVRMLVGAQVEWIGRVDELSSSAYPTGGRSRWRPLAADGIEPDERVSHAADPALWLARAARLAPES